MTSPVFEEEAWQQAVADQSTALLYAPHVKDGVYFNPWMPMQSDRFAAFLKWRFSKKASYTDKEETYLPAVQPDLLKRLRNMGAGNSISWVGHATFLIKTAGATWLTDPILSQRALLPKRLTPPALTLDELSKLGQPLYVLISHNHYDHLDKASLKALPNYAHIFVPPGLKAIVQSYFKGKVQEIDWWTRIDLDTNIKLVALPTQHWSRRIGQNVNTSLWSSYLLQTPAGTIYYGGDSGYFIGYQEFGRRFSEIDYALIPLTAYHPRWFMHYAHMNASETIQAFQDLGARYYIPTQWGTFRLGDNPPGFPVLDLKHVIQQRNLDPAPFRILDIGQIEVME
jgi:L-ascorbate metabolism protein UlaG (beta-lactamase superfamily)